MSYHIWFYYLPTIIGHLPYDSYEMWKAAGRQKMWGCGGARGLYHFHAFVLTLIRCSEHSHTTADSCMSGGSQNRAKQGGAVNLACDNHKR